MFLQRHLVEDVQALQITALLQLGTPCSMTACTSPSAQLMNASHPHLLQLRYFAVRHLALPSTAQLKLLCRSPHTCIYARLAEQLATLQHQGRVSHIRSARISMQEP